MVIGNPITLGGSGGGSLPIMTQQEWNALSTAQKQAYGYVGITNRDVGLYRGKLLYGADFTPSLIPFTPNTIIAEAKLFDPVVDGAWGESVLVENVTVNNDGTLTTNDSSTSLPISVILPNTTGPFTAYIVSKRISGGNRMIMSFGNESGDPSDGLGLLRDSDGNVTLSLWGDDTQFSYHQNQWNHDGMCCACLAFDDNNTLAWGYVLRSDLSTVDSLSKTMSTRNSSRIVVGKTFPTHGNETSENRTITTIGYLAVTNGFDGEQNIIDNLISIANSFDA